MVLVDPAIPDQIALQQCIAPQFATVSRALEDQVVKQRQDCAAALRGGVLKSGTPRFERCTAPPGVPDIFHS
jgi:hypothetical protein